jgi:hypothetical protein
MTFDKDRPCATMRCIKTRISAGVRDRIRELVPGFFGKHPDGIGAADISIEYDPPRGQLDPRGPQDGSISVSVSVPSIGVEENFAIPVK